MLESELRIKLDDKVERFRSFGSRWSWASLEELGQGGQALTYTAYQTYDSAVLEKQMDAFVERLTALFKACAANPRSLFLEKNVPEMRALLLNAFQTSAHAATGPDLYVLKVYYLRDDSNAAELLERATRETRILQSVHHSGILRILDYGTIHSRDQNDRPWAVYEYCEGGTLAQHVESYRGNARRSLNAVQRLSGGLAALHSQDVVHRDIKLENIFVRRDGSLVLGDFGLVRTMGKAAEARVTKSGRQPGNWEFYPDWADFALAQPPSKEADIYALMKVLWCLVTGEQRLPREDWNRPEFDVERLFSGQPIMSEIRRLLKKTVVRTQAEARVSSAADLVHEINAILEKSSH